MVNGNRLRGTAPGQTLPSRQGGFRLWRASSCLLLLLLLGGCIDNPVTGARQIGFIGTADEIAIGMQHYGPTQQMEGGRYTLEPALENYVADVTARLARHSERELPYEVVLLNASVPNAWALPGGKLAINRGLLLELDNEAELAAVLAHEIIHAAARHGARAVERGMLLEGAVLIAAMASEGSDYFPFVVGGAQLGAMLIHQGYSREAEREADRYGMELMQRAGYDAAAAVSLQETFVRLAEDRRSSWLSGWFASHPPSAERVAANRATAQRLPEGGELGAERYQAAVAELRRRAPAFAAADEGRLALRRNDLPGAEASVLEALALEPQEPSFHGLLGDLRRRQGRLQEAISAYDAAIARDPNHYAYWQGRGLAQRQLQQNAAARADLERGIALLPTAEAMNALGQMALAAGQIRQARTYLNQAASAAGPAAEEARRSLARLDLPAHPERFLAARTLLDERGRLWLEVSNRSPLNVDGINIELRLPRSDGQWVSRRLRLPRPLAAGDSLRFDTGLQLPADSNLPAGSARVIAARVLD